MTDREARWKAWMIAALAGDEAAYRRLLSDVAAALRPVARRGLERAGRSGSDAEDIVQETLIALHQKRHTWRPSEPVGPWLRAIARYKLVDALRARGARRDIPIDDIADTLVANDVNDGLAKKDLLRLADRLPSGQRDAVRMFAITGGSAREVAAALGMTEGAVRVALHRGVAALAAFVRTKA